MMIPDETLLLVFVGFFSIYCELIWPGRLIPGLLGLVLLVVGVSGLLAMSLSSSGIGMIGLAAALFLLECLWQVDLWAGLTGTVSLGIGICLLLKGPAQFSWVLAIPVCLCFGCVTTFLADTAKRGRRNKRIGRNFEVTRP